MQKLNNNFIVSFSSFGFIAHFHNVSMSSVILQLLLIKFKRKLSDNDWLIFNGWEIENENLKQSKTIFQVNYKHR